MKLRISYVYGVQSLKEGNFISLATSVLYMKVNLSSITTPFGAGITFFLILAHPVYTM